jgi:hypothetical protein
MENQERANAQSYASPTSILSKTPCVIVRQKLGRRRSSFDIKCRERLGAAAGIYRFGYPAYEIVSPVLLPDGFAGKNGAVSQLFRGHASC